MRHWFTRREFLVRAGAAAACAGVGTRRVRASGEQPDGWRGRVVVARDEKLMAGKPEEHRELVHKLLDAAMQKLTGAPDAAAAWRKLFKPGERVGIKVNALGFSSQPVVADAIVAGLRQAGVSAEKTVIWDRFDVELARAGFKLNKSSTGVQCRGTDAERYGSGYQKDVETSGQIGSCFSRILTEDTDALISVPVLKDHNLAGVSLSMKNFFGAIHNPNKYHENACDPMIVDVIQHRFVASKWRLTVLDGLRAQYHGGPGPNPAFQWDYGGLMVGTDYVAIDAVGADLIDTQRKEKGLKVVAEENRPYKYIATAAARGLGEANLQKIERLAV